MPELPEKLTSRKLWFFTGLALTFTWMQTQGHLSADGSVYSQLMMWTMIGFAGGNVGEHFASR